MNNVYRITGSIKDGEYNEEFTTVMVGNDIKRIISSFLDKFPEAEVLEVDRLNYAGEEVFDII